MVQLEKMVRGGSFAGRPVGVSWHGPIVYGCDDWDIHNRLD